MRLAVLRAAGRSVPADVALVGYDNGAVALVTDPPLTTVVNPVVQMARTAGLVLLDRILRDEPLGAADDVPARTGRPVVELTDRRAARWLEL